MPQTNRITPMLHRKWIIWNLSIAIFFRQIWNNYLWLEAMALHCAELEDFSYELMLKWEKLFSGNCTQFSSQLLNCPRWGAHKSLSNPENGLMWKLLLHPNSCWRPSCTRLVDVEALETKLPENILTDSHDLYADTEQTDQGLVGESWQ